MLNKNNFSIFILNITKNNSSILTDTMSSYGYVCNSNHNINESYEFIQNNNIDLIILNSDSTLENEINIIKHIKNISNSKIIFLSSVIDSKYQKICLDLKLLDFIIKQNNIIAISSKIDKLITKLILNKKETILIVKKSNENRILIEEMLRSRDYNIKVAENGAQGWKEIDNSDEISMIILTPKMNDMDYLEIITKAKRKYTADIPILALCDKYNAIELKEYMANGFCDFLTMEQLDEQFNLRIDLWIENVRQKREINIQKNKLVENLNSFKALANSTIEGLIMFENNICVDVNDEAIKMFRYSNKEDLVGKNILKVVPDTLSIYDKTQLLENNIDHEFEIEMKKKDNTIFPAQVKERNITLDNKTLKILAVLDLTDIKRKEHMLSQQSKMASMGEMMSNIAHQWRQPLTSISISASSVNLSYELNMIEEDEIHEQMENIIKGTEFLSKTIDDFQNFLNNSNEQEEFKIKEVVSQVLTLIDGNLKKNNITITQNYKYDENILGIKNELIQAILNIINNSKDALLNKEDERIINIEVVENDSKDYCILSIQDNAGGIPENIIDKIFEPYFTTKHQNQGTGLGLYMTHQIIVDHMHGKLEVKNEDFLNDDKLSFGAIFKIMLPIK